MAEVLAIELAGQVESLTLGRDTERARGDAAAGALGWRGRGRLRKGIQ